MSAPELKPCPFCGGHAVALSGPVKTRWGVSCLRCACWIYARAPTASEAIAAWNTRTDLIPSDPRVKALVEAVAAAFACRMIPKSTAADGGASKYSEQVRVADQLRAALAALKGAT